MFIQKCIVIVILLWNTQSIVHYAIKLLILGFGIKSVEREFLITCISASYAGSCAVDLHLLNG